MISCFMSMGFSRQEYWSELPCPPSGDLPDWGTELMSALVSCIAGWFFTHWATWKAQEIKYLSNSLLFSLPHWRVSSRRAGPLSAALPASRMQHPAQSEYSINIYWTGECAPLPSHHSLSLTYTSAFSPTGLCIPPAKPARGLWTLILAHEQSLLAMSPWVFYPLFSFLFSLPHTSPLLYSPSWSRTFYPRESHKKHMVYVIFWFTDTKDA